jgi:hypothetical protein
MTYLISFCPICLASDPEGEAANSILLFPQCLAFTPLPALLHNIPSLTSLSLSFGSIFCWVSFLPSTFSRLSLVLSYTGFTPPNLSMGPSCAPVPVGGAFRQKEEIILPRSAMLNCCAPQFPVLVAAYARSLGRRETTSHQVSIVPRSYHALVAPGSRLFAFPAGQRSFIPRSPMRSTFASPPASPLENCSFSSFIAPSLFTLSYSDPIRSPIPFARDGLWCHKFPSS